MIGYRCRSAIPLVFLLNLSLASFAQVPLAQPFWRVKEKVFKKIEHERAVITSVKTVKVKEQNLKPLKPKQNKRLIMQGGCLVSRPLDMSFQLAKEYEKLKAVSDHIKVSQWKPKSRRLYLHTEAFDFHAKMTMLVDSEHVSQELKKIRFHVIDGSFNGLEGQFSFSRHKRKTLMGFYAFYDYENLPMPQFFVEFALEVVLQKVAGLMRKHLERAEVERPSVGSK